jgi:transcriptional regulator with XRE-family HTH domain
MQKKENNQTQAAQDMQRIVRNNIRMLLARFPEKSQSDFAAALGLAQASVSRKLNNKAEWTSADIANAATYFSLPFYVLVSPTALKDYLFEEPAYRDYHLAHDAPSDNSQHELVSASGSASAGAGMARYYRQPEGGEENKTHGAVGPRAFVMASLDADLIGPGAMGSRFSARSRFGCPRWDSNPHCADFEAASSTNWDTGACAQLWNCTT